MPRWCPLMVPGVALGGTSVAGTLLGPEGSGPPVLVLVLRSCVCVVVCWGGCGGVGCFWLLGLSAAVPAWCRWWLVVGLVVG